MARIFRHRDLWTGSLAFRHTAAGGDGGCDPRGLGVSGSTGQAVPARYRAGPVRSGGRDIPDRHLRHRRTQCGRHALRAHRCGLCRDRRLGADPRIDAPRGGVGAGDHHRGLPRLRLYRPPAARHSRGAEGVFVATFLWPCLLGCGHPGADDRRFLDLHHPVYHLRSVPSGVEGRRLFRQLRLCRRRALAGRPGQGGHLCFRPDGHDQRHLGGQRGRWPLPPPPLCRG